MNKYWIIVNGQPIGPFTASEIKVRRDFTASLPVWSTNMPDWSTAGQVPELAQYLDCGASEVSTPQEAEEKPKATSSWINPAQAPVQEGVKPPTYLVWNIILLLLANMLCGIIGVIFGLTVTRRWYAGNPEGAQKASNGAAWCIMIGIVLGLITWPFQLLVPYII